VASLTEITGKYVTVESVLPQTVHYVASLDGAALGFSQVPRPTNPPLLAGYNFENGFFMVYVANVAPGGAAEVKILLPPGAAPDTYFMFGPEPGILDDHWYEFAYDGTTGAEINGSEVMLHFVDGQRGDSDLTANGIIADPGGPATVISNANLTSASGGSGCALRTAAARPAQAGDWWLLLLWLGVMYRLRRMLRTRRVTGAYGQAA